MEKAKPDPYVELTPDQRYVAELKDLGRVKLAARAESGQDDQWLHAAQPARLYQGFSCRKICPAGKPARKPLSCNAFQKYRSSTTWHFWGSDTLRTGAGGARCVVIAMKAYRFALALSLIALGFTQEALSQTMKSATGRGEPRITSSPRAAYNSMGKTTTPFNCEQYRAHPHPSMKGYCDGLEASTLQSEARRAGRPGPSSEVIELPSMGSQAAKSSGYACIGGQAMRKLPNGWAQVSSPNGGWQRCREQ